MKHERHAALRSAPWVLALSLAGCNASPQAEKEERIDSRSETVSSYCARFARQYAALNAMVYDEGSARTVKKSDAMAFLSNLFSPADSRFTAGFRCRFRAACAGRSIHSFSVDILLANTSAFAEHTKWERLQSLPVEHVVDDASGRAGYGVFKYLDRE